MPSEIIEGSTVPSLAYFRNLALAVDPGARRIRAELRRLSNQIPPAERALDLGSGHAPYARLFRHRKYLTADLLAKADVRCDATSLPFASEAFDLILCTEVLEHVPNPDATLREAHRLLKGNGCLVLSTPLTWGVHDARDFHRWTDSGLRQLLAKHQFEVIDLRARGGVLLCLGSLLLVIPWQLLGGSGERRLWQSALFAALYSILLPAALILGALDVLDRRRHFTHGYVALCRPV